MKSSIIFFAVLVTCALAQIERCRKTPVPQWYGYMHESNHEAGSPREPTIRRAAIYYDATNERINITETELFEPGDRSYKYSELYFHKTTPPMRYRVYTEGESRQQRCEKTELDYPFRPFGVPENATFGGIDYLGAEITGLGLLVDSFYERTERGGDYHGFWAPSTSPSSGSCVPIIETYRNRQGPVPSRTNIHIRYEYIVPVSPSTPFPLETFTIPAICR